MFAADEEERKEAGARAAPGEPPDDRKLGTGEDPRPSPERRRCFALLKVDPETGITDEQINDFLRAAGIDPETVVEEWGKGAWSPPFSPNEPRASPSCPASSPR